MKFELIGGLIQSLGFRVTLVICAATIAGAIYALATGYRFYLHGDEDGARPGFGQIVEAKQDVRLKTAMRVGWRSAAVTREVQYGDSYFTGPSSSLKISFKDQGELYLGPGSLITFPESVADSGRNVDIKYGDIEVQLLPEKAITVTYQKKSFQVKASGQKAALSIRADKKIVVKSVEGKSTLRAANKEILIEREKPPVEIQQELLEIAPVPTPTLVASPTLAPTLTPSSTMTPAPTAPPVVTPSPVPTLVAKKVKVPLKTPALLPTRSPTPIRTPMVTPTPTPKAPSPTATPALKALDLPMPRLMEPFRDSVIYFAPDQPMKVTFAWDSASKGSFELQYSPLKDFSGNITTKTVSKSSIQIVFPKDAILFWRVRVLDRGQGSDWSEVRMLTVAKSR